MAITRHSPNFLRCSLFCRLLLVGFLLLAEGIEADGLQPIGDGRELTRRRCQLVMRPVLTVRNSTGLHEARVGLVEQLAVILPPIGLERGQIIVGDEQQEAAHGFRQLREAQRLTGQTIAQLFDHRRGSREVKPNDVQRILLRELSAVDRHVRFGETAEDPGHERNHLIGVRSAQENLVVHHGQYFLALATREQVGDLHRVRDRNQGDGSVHDLDEDLHARFDDAIVHHIA